MRQEQLRLLGRGGKKRQKGEGQVNAPDSLRVALEVLDQLGLLLAEAEEWETLAQVTEVYNLLRAIREQNLATGEFAEFAVPTPAPEQSGN